MTKRPKGFFTGAEADARAGKASMSPGTHHGGGGRGGAPGTSTKATHVPTTKRTIKPRDHTGKVITALGYATNINPIKAVGSAITWGKSLFKPKTEQQKVDANIAKGYDVMNPAEMHRATTRTPIDRSHEGGDGMANVTTHTQSLVTAPTADKGAGFGHQWNFQAYGANQNVAGNPYDYKAAPYAKKGKLIRKYGTGQEIKNFSKGKRFGPPPLKGPDPQGLQVILENSDYFKKLIG